MHATLHTFSIKCTGRALLFVGILLRNKGDTVIHPAVSTGLYYSHRFFFATLRSIIEGGFGKKYIRFASI